MDKQTKFSLWGALIGDYYGSYWEFRTDKPRGLKDALKLRKDGHFFTDDTFMTLAIAQAVMDDGNLSVNAVKRMREIGNKHWGSYGGSFACWLKTDKPEPYWSFGNGASMRVSAAGLLANSLKDAESKSADATKVTHDHPFGMFYAIVVAELIYLAKQKDATMGRMKDYLATTYPELWNHVSKLDLEGLHRDYGFTESSQGTVPQAIYCFVTSKSFGDCLARSLYVGGDSDTLSAIACSIAAPFYGDGQVKPFVDKVADLPEDLNEIMSMFYKKHMC